MPTAKIRVEVELTNVDDLVEEIFDNLELAREKGKDEREAVRKVLKKLTFISTDF